jgi:exodeoxyribonuclease-3
VTRFATWNVNSLNVRQQRVEHWIADIAPDIVCLQETKLADEAFPALAFEAMGYESVHHGEGRWNGVAILSKVGLIDPVLGFADGAEPDAEARLVTAMCGGVSVVNVYVPNGRSLDDPHYQYKLGWLARLGKHVDRLRADSREVIIAGDFNIAPADVDVYDPAAFVRATHTSQPERNALHALVERGFEDVFRRVHPDATSVFSWWDYRRGDFHEGRGMRIDLVLASEAVAARVDWCIIDRNARKGQQPSDHAPVVVDLTD